MHGIKNISSYLINYNIYMRMWNKNNKSNHMAINVIICKKKKKILHTHFSQYINKPTLHYAN